MVVLQSVIATAQTFPAHPRKGFIYDGAHLLKTSDEEKVDSLSRTFKSKAGAPIVVATLPSLATMDAKSIGIEKYATALFDEWRIGSREHNWGILLLVSKADHKARIEFGKAWGHDADTQSHAIMQAAILPAFKRGDYSDGIVKGCEALAKLTPSVTPSTAPATTVSNASPPQLTEISGPPVEFVDGPQNIDSGGGFLSSGLLFLIVPVVFLIIIVAAVAGRRRGGLSRTYNSPFGTGRQRLQLDDDREQRRFRLQCGADRGERDVATGLRFRHFDRLLALSRYGK